MAITKVIIKNITVFDTLELPLSEGINVFIGENGTGKTHLLKLLYSACRAADPKVSFPQKIVRCFAPDDYQIARLVRKKQGTVNASVRVVGSDGGKNTGISAQFSNRDKKWENAKVTKKDEWGRQRDGLSSIFIPAKEILSHACKLNAAAEMNVVSFDDTYLDVINAAKIPISPGKNTAVKQELLRKIEQIIAGRVSLNDKRDEFYLRRGNSVFEFSLVAEGIRKIALLWQLVKNGILVDGSVLFWDEPEANINPAHIPVLAAMLMELQRNGVQIFIATHDYFLSKYLEVERTESDHVMFHSFFLDEQAAKAESAQKFEELAHNAILKTFIALYKQEIDKAMDI